MRCMLKLQMDTEAGNRAIADGTLPKIMEKLAERTQPEASYFTAEDGCRTAFIFFDLKDPSDIPMIAEPAFTDLKAKVTFVPVMNGEDLEKGLTQLR